MAGGASMLNPLFILPKDKSNVSASLNLHKKYRSNFEIIASMLETVNGNGAAGYFTMQRVGINNKQLKKYLGFLSDRGFIEISIIDGQVIYKASEKGNVFLKQYNVLMSMLLNTQLEVTRRLL